MNCEASAAAVVCCVPDLALASDSNALKRSAWGRDKHHSKLGSCYLQTAGTQTGKRKRLPRWVHAFALCTPLIFDGTAGGFSGT